MSWPPHPVHQRQAGRIDRSAHATRPLCLTGEGLSVGYDFGDVVASAYPYRYPFSDGTIHTVVYDVEDDLYIDLERAFARRIATD